MPNRSVSLLLAVALIAGCKPAAQAGDAPAAVAAETPAAAATPAVAAQTAAAPAATVAIDAGFKEGMPYATLRKQLIDAGWLPLRDPECWKNAGPGSTVCGLLPEVESCSGDGYCNMYFASAEAGKRIEIGTYPETRAGARNAAAIGTVEGITGPSTAIDLCSCGRYSTEKGGVHFEVTSIGVLPAG